MSGAPQAAALLLEVASGFAQDRRAPSEKKKRRLCAGADPFARHRLTPSEIPHLSIQNVGPRAAAVHDQAKLVGQGEVAKTLL